MPDHVRIPLLSAASLAAAAGHPLGERDGLAILLEALRFSARRGISVADGALCIDAEGRISFRAHDSDVPRRDPAAQVQAACALADALFAGTPPLPLEPRTFPTLDQMIVAAELRVLRSGDTQIATQSEARRAAAALFARANEPAEPPDVSEAITDKLPPSEPVSVVPPPPDEPLLAEIPGLSERDLHREATWPEPAVPPPQPSAEVARARDETPIVAPALAAESSRPPSARGQWMLPAALLLATASTFPFGRRSAAPIRSSPPQPVPTAKRDDSQPPPPVPAKPAAKVAAAKKPAPPVPKTLAAASMVPTDPPEPPARPNSRAAAQKLEAGEKAFRAGRYFQAIIAFREALEGPAPIARAARRLGDVYLLQDEREKAAAAYRQYLDLDPDAPDGDEVEDALDEIEQH